MNRRSIVICSVIALLLLGGVGGLFYFLFFAGNGKAVETDRLTEGVQAIPSDAVFLFEAGSFSDIVKMTDERSALGKIAGCIPDVSSDWEAALSMHYSSKNAVSPLLVITVPEKEDASAFLSQILDECGGVIEKRYGQQSVFKAAVPDASFALCGRFLIASPSLVIVESSLRQMESGMSVKDEPLYSKIHGVTSDRGVLHVNFSNIGKFFSGAVSRSWLGKASFFQNFADWGTFGLSDGDNPWTMDGKVTGVMSGENFSDVLLTQRGRRPEVFAVVPHDALYVFTLPLTSYSEYVRAYHSYLSANGLRKDYDYLNAILPSNDGLEISTSAFAASLDLTEAAVFAIGASGERILALRSGNTGALGGGKDTVNTYLYKGYISTFLGDAFAPSSEDSYVIHGDWILIGGEETLKSLTDKWKRGGFFSMADYVAQTPASEELRELSCASLFINAVRYADGMASFFRKPYSEAVASAFGVHNFELLVLNTYKTGGDLGVRLSVYSEDLSELPQPEPEEGVSGVEIVDDTPVDIPEGPFKVKNFIDGSDNWLEQLDNHDLRLLNSARRPVWTVKFDRPLCGTVRQIDYLKNNKLQMLFGAGSKMYLLDRLGRKVGKFPIDLGKEILLGPDVYDFSGDRDYTLMVLHADNTVAQYDIAGERIPGWNDIKLQERIVGLPRLLEMESGVYWIVRTSYQTLIYDAHGTICADFTKKNKLKKDTAVEPVSSSKVKVTTMEGRTMFLNLKDGSFSRR
ncbi:MAG TPA: hypothetical protein IAC04_07290 [Candidatus Coprenecus stercoravium]|uniref:DUF3352 domain-containing protein n=1 Tax=Candidatus Coprenecus stercoravium TaxID=2840735 RepID=A0A9D2GRU5_9BACT|nr:hypothetical protein [Candidatus Coprenecus stercoravium]